MMSVQEVGVEALLQATGLSAAVLLHALTPLISEGGLLTCSRPSDPSQGQTCHLPSLSGRSLWSNLGFALIVFSGVLQLNQQMVACSLDGSVASVQLLPSQTYLNVDEDATGALERKRNYIYCVIVHIMKEEKQMHIDNLVFKVTQIFQPLCPTRTSSV